MWEKEFDLPELFVLLVQAGKNGISLAIKGIIFSV
jgi:hypothetical protein